MEKASFELGLFSWPYSEFTTNNLALPHWEIPSAFVTYIVKWQALVWDALKDYQGFPPLHQASHWHES